QIGLLADSTGPISTYYDGFISGAEIAIQLLNDEWAGIYSFELVTGDTGCDSITAASSAQSLLDSNVTGVVGAYCSGASMGANPVLSAASVPMISPASTSPALSDSSAYPDFFRMVPGDQAQGIALAEWASNATSVGLVYEISLQSMADGFLDTFEGINGDGSVCASASFDWDPSYAIQEMGDEGCENLTILTYDSSALAWAIEESYGLGLEPGWVLAPTYVVYSDFCDSSLTEPSLCEGLVYLSEPSYSSDLSEQFHEACDDDTDCSGGIYTAHTFDAVYLMGSAMGYQDYQGYGNLSEWIPSMVEGGWEAASGYVSFMANGDPLASYDFCRFEDGGNDTYYEDCYQTWTQSETQSEVSHWNPINITWDVIGYNNTTGNPEIWLINISNSNIMGTNVSLDLTEENGCFGWIYELNNSYFYLHGSTVESLTLTLSPGSIGYGDCDLSVNATAHDLTENWSASTLITATGPNELVGIVLDLYLIQEEHAWASGETVIGDLETDVPSFGTLNDSFSLGVGDLAWISYETDAYSLYENSLVLYCDYCPELQYTGDNESAAWNHSNQQFIWEVFTFENNSSGSLGPFSGEGNWTLVMNDYYGDGGMIAGLEIWDYDPDYLPEGNNSMWISASNLTVGMEYDMLWITHVDGVLTNSSWSGSNHSYPNPIWTAYSDFSGEFWNLWISFEDCYIEVYVDIYEADSNSTNWSFAGEELFGMTGPSCTGLTNPYSTLYGWSEDLGYYIEEPEALANGTNQMGWVVDDLQPGIDYNLTWEYRVDDGDWQQGEILLNSNGSSETVWWNLTIDQYACTIEIWNSLEAEFAVYEDSLWRTMQGPCQDPPTAYEDLYLYSEEVGWIYEPTELPGGTNEMAWIFQDLMPGETYEIQYNYYRRLPYQDGSYQDDFIGSGSWEFTATSDYEIIYWNLTVDEYHCNLVLNTYIQLQGESSAPVSPRYFAGPCYEDPIPYVDYLVYDNILEEWIHVPDYLAAGAYSMAVVIGDVEGEEIYLELGSSSVTSNGSQYNNTVFSSEESSAGGCDEDGDGEIDSINMSQEGDCTWDGSFTGGENATVLYWQTEISEEICTISLNGSLMYQSNDTQLATTDSLDDLVLGPCQDESSTTTPEFHLYSFVNEGGYYELEPTELPEGTTLMAWLVTNLTGNDYSGFTLEYSVTVDGSSSDYNHTTNDNYDGDGDGEAENEAAFFWYITIQPETCDITISATLIADNSTHSDEVQHQEFEIDGPCEEVPVPYVGLYSYDDFSGSYSEIPTNLDAGTNPMAWSMGNLTIGTGYFLSYNVTVDGNLSVTGWNGFTANETTETLPWTVYIDQHDCLVEASYELYDSADWSLLASDSVSLSAPCVNESTPFVTVTSYDDSVGSFTPLGDSIEAGTHLMSLTAANLTAETSYWMVLVVFIDGGTTHSNSTGFSVQSAGETHSFNWNMTISDYDCDVVISHSLYEDSVLVAAGNEAVDGPCEDPPELGLEAVWLAQVNNVYCNGSIYVDLLSEEGPDSLESSYDCEGEADVYNDGFSVNVETANLTEDVDRTYVILVAEVVATGAYGNDTLVDEWLVIRDDAQGVSIPSHWIESWEVNSTHCQVDLFVGVYTNWTDEGAYPVDSMSASFDGPCEDPPELGLEAVWLA
ncbi:MAG: ABC transporter substrate-binding protein, partial [Candidatus Poseidoniales archaeon]